MFDKWKPNEFHDFTEPHAAPHLVHHYVFDFATVWIQLHPHAHSYEITFDDTFGDGRTSEKLFNPDIFELYRDGKRWLQERVNELSVTYPHLKTVTIDDYARLSRITALGVSLDIEGLGINLNKGRASIDPHAHKVYEDLESCLRDTVGIATEEVVPNYVLGYFPLGTAK